MVEDRDLVLARVSPGMTFRSRRMPFNPLKSGGCCTPDCHERAGHGRTGRFCAEHAEVLAAIRVSHEADVLEHGMHGKRSNVRKGRKFGSTCCNPYCVNPRPPRATYCDDCVDAGMVAED